MSLTIDNYELGERIGSGGFGDVYRARRLDLDREDAIKILHAEHCRDASAVARFVAEARAAGKIAHPGIVRVFELGTLADGRSFCVMELLRGKTLRALIDERGRLPLAEAVPLLAKIAAAVDAAHAAGVAHRDLKPENLFVEADGSIRLIDFGLAKLAHDQHLTTTGRVMGSPRYMSPEQCRGSGVDERSDLYSFGALAYHLLVGAPPFEGDVLALALQHLNDAPAAPSSRVAELPPSVDVLLLALLAKDPARRPRPLAAAVASLETGTLPRTRARLRLPLVVAAATLAVAGSAFAIIHGAHASEPDVVTAVAAPDGLRLIEQRPFALKGGGAFDLDGSFIEQSATRILHHRNDGSTVDEPVGYLARLPDGRRLFATPNTDVTDAIQVEDKHGARAELVHGPVNGYALSPDGKLIAVVRGNDLALHDIATGQERTFAHDVNAVTVTFSPNSKLLTWVSSESSHLEIAPIAGGPTREFVLRLLSDSGFSTPAFVDDTHILYCATDGEHSAVRLRTLDQAAGLGRVVRDLDPDIGDCQVNVSGRRVAVDLVGGRRQAVTLDPMTHEIKSLGLAPATQSQAVAEDGKTIIASVPPHTFQDLVSIDRATRAITPLAPCQLPLPTVSFNGRSGIERFETDRDLGVVRFFDLQCAPLSKWSLAPHVAFVTDPRCGGGVCVVATWSQDKSIHLWSLDADKPAREFASITNAQEPDNERWIVDIAPDGHHGVLLAQVGNDTHSTPYLFATDGTPVKRLDLNLDLPVGPQSIVWGADASHFILTPIFRDGQYRVMSMAVDGSSEVWQTPTDYFFGVTRSPDGREVFGEFKHISHNLLMYEITGAL